MVRALRQLDSGHEYCPPEYTPSEMERLIGMHHEHERARRLPPPLEVAWLHYRFVQTHQFEDGNDRTARLLMSHVFAKRGEPIPVITALERPMYFDALQEADRGDLRTFVRMLKRKAIEGHESAAYSIRKMLEGRHEYFHMKQRPEREPPGERMDASSRDERTRERDRLRCRGRGDAGERREER